MAATLKPDSDGAERLVFLDNSTPSRLLPASFLRHTLSKPDRHITAEMEAESLARILTREDEKRLRSA